jgi:hypothetical protein
LPNAILPPLDEEGGIVKRAYPKVLARLAEGQIIRPPGREAETLLMLVQRGCHGVRAYDFAGGPPFRLGAYVHDLRRMGLAIRTDREPHAGGEHGVYVLGSPVTVLQVLRAEESGHAA